MKGLLRLDAYQLCAHAKATLLVVAVMIFLGGTMMGSDGIFFVAYGGLMIGIMPMTLLSYEEKDGWQSYVKTLPVSREQIVGAKYLLGLLMAVVGAALALVSMRLAPLAGKAWPQGSAAAVAAQVMIAAIVSNIFVLPLCYRFGVNKGRVVYLLLIGASCGAIAAFTETSVGSAGVHSNVLSLSASLSGIHAGSLCIALAVVAAAYALSWRLSVAWYGKAKDV